MARAIRRHVREGGHEWALALQRANERMISLTRTTECWRRKIPRANRRSLPDANCGSLNSSTSAIQLRGGSIFAGMVVLSVLMAVVRLAQAQQHSQRPSGYGHLQPRWLLSNQSTMILSRSKRTMSGMIYPQAKTTSLAPTGSTRRKRLRA